MRVFYPPSPCSDISSFSGDYSELSYIIPSGETMIVDVLSSGDVGVIEYTNKIISNDLTYMERVIALNKGSDIDYNRYSVIGDNINFAQDILFSGININYEITNNTHYDLEIDMSRRTMFT